MLVDLRLPVLRLVGCFIDFCWLLIFLNQKVWQIWICRIQGILNWFWELLVFIYRRICTGLRYWGTDLELVAMHKFSLPSKGSWGLGLRCCLCHRNSGENCWEQVVLLVRPIECVRCLPSLAMDVWAYPEPLLVCGRWTHQRLGVVSRCWNRNLLILYWFYWNHLHVEQVLPDIAMGFCGVWISSIWLCLDLASPPSPPPWKNRSPWTPLNLRNSSARKSSSTLTPHSNDSWIWCLVPSLMPKTSRKQIMGCFEKI